MENELFEKMPISKAYFKLALPVVIGMVVSLVYNLADTWFIARTANTALVAGVSLCAPVFTLMVAFSDIFGLGGSNLISRLLGQKNQRGAAGVSAFSIYGSIGFGCLTALVLLMLRTPILTLLGAAEDTLPYAMEYYTWLAAGAPIVILNVVPGNLLRTEGLSGSAMICTVIGAILNIVLDPIFIYVLGLGAGGAALATVLSNFISDILLLVTMKKKASTLSIRPSDCRISGAMLRDVLFIGIPASTTNIMQSLATLLTNRCLVSYGTDKVAALGIAMKINMICTLVLVGFAFGIQPAFGYCYGAGNEKRLKEFVRFDLKVLISLSAGFLVVAFVFSRPILQVFMSDTAVVNAGVTILRCLMISGPAVGIVLALTTLFQAEGKAFAAFILAFSRQGVVLVICLYGLRAVMGYIGILLAQPAADVLTVGIGLLLLRKTNASVNHSSRMLQ